MERKEVSGIMLTLLLIGMLTSTFNPKVIGITCEGKSSQKSLRIHYASLESSLPPPTQWNQTYGGNLSDWAYSVVESGDGGYAIAGRTLSFGVGSADFWLVKTDSNGNVQWNKTYGGTSADGACAIIRTNDGGYALAGYTYSFGVGFWLVKTDLNGNVQWNKTYGEGGAVSAYSIVQTSDGGYALAGYRTYYESIMVYDFRLVKTDSSGNMQWNKTYNRGELDIAYSIVQTNDEGYAIAGTTFKIGDPEDKYYDFWLIKTDSLGNMQWDRTYGGTGADGASCVIQTDDGGYAIAGSGFANLLKTDAYGNQQWSKGYGARSCDSVVQTIDGGYALAGSTESFGAGSYDFWLIKLGPEVHDIAVTDIAPSKNVISQGFTLNISVTVANEGNYPETFNVTAYANTSSIGNQSIINLDSGANKILTFAWNTSGFDIGNYTISAVADTVTNETNTSDNTYIDGIVIVRLPLHDVAVVDATPASNVVLSGFNLNISVTVENQGDFVETFNVTAYANTTTIEEQEVFLNSGESAILVFTWNTSGFSLGNYNISAYATPVAEEIDKDDNNFKDGVATVRPPGDVAVINVTPSKTVVGQGYSVPINVTVENQGDFTETFNVTAYHNDTAVILPNGKDYTTVTLTSGSSTTLTFTWNTTGFAKGIYTIKAVAATVPGEIDTDDNALIDGVMRIAKAGDFGTISGGYYDFDGLCDYQDLFLFRKAYVEAYHPLCDFDNDLDVDYMDLFEFRKCYIAPDP